jgi:predicted nucleic acid-binding protein
MSAPILIDTCAWVAFLRSGQGTLAERVAQAVGDDSAMLCGVTITELLQGAKGAKEKQQLDFLFANVPCVPVEPADWVAAGNTLQTLRLKGITLPLTDALIATIAKRKALPVLTIDAHFQHLAVGLVDPTCLL